MAGDWIKMRVDLFTSPKVVRIASALKVDRLRTVGGLMSAWCLFNVHSEDGFLPDYTKNILDDLVGLIGFAEQMEAVGWLESSPEGLKIPRFDAHNGASAKRRAMDADRKRLGRDENKKQINLHSKTADNTKKQNALKVSASKADKNRTREEKRREELNNKSNDLLPEITKKSTRLPDDWRPTQDYVDAAKALNPDYSPDWFRTTAHKFRDYWIAKSGKDATKADWLATWRNWIRNDLEFKRANKNAKQQPKIDHDNTDWVNLVFGEPGSGDLGEQNFPYIEGDFSSVEISDTRPGLSEPGQS